MYLERNVFIAGSNDRASLVKPGGDGCNDSGKYCDKAPGLLAAVGNYLGNGAHLITNHPEQVFRPSAYYRYTARPATMALASLVAARAGTR
jgi:hypothetical protein